MTRKLPWKRQGQGEARSTARPSPNTAGQRLKAEAFDSDGSKAIKGSFASASAARRKVRRSKRSTSTSPPPEPVEERYMLEGLDGDDQYRMVEDEFYATAQKFTAHLHRAEYERLKAAAKTQNAATIRNISRPVVGSMTELVRKRQEQKLRVQKQRQAIRRALAKDDDLADSESERDDTWHGSALYGLMESPRRKAPRLDRLAAVSTTTTRTRAAAGFSGSQEAETPLLNRPRPTFNEIPGLGKAKKEPKPQTRPDTDDDDDDDDDLDVPTRRSTLSSTTSLSGTKRPRSSSVKPSRAVLHETPRAMASSSRTVESAPEPASSSDDSSGGLFSHLKKRRAQHNSRGQRKSE